jgi:hypothetical protein
MIINVHKSTVSFYRMEAGTKDFFKSLFPFEILNFQEGIKYLGFHLKPNDYRKSDWRWLLAKLENRLKGWSFRWLSRAGRLTLTKSVLEAIPVYWMSLAWIPKGLLEKSRKLCFRFIWSGTQEAFTTPWAKWDLLAHPKALGGWGLKNIFMFAKALATKSGWRLLTTDSLWSTILIQKYIRPDSLEDWIRKPEKKLTNCSIIWKSIQNYFQVISDGLAWKVGNGSCLRIGLDPWPGSGVNHSLRPELIDFLHQQGIYYLTQVSDPYTTNIWQQGWKNVEALGLHDPLSEPWNRYILSLQSSHIHITEEEDKLVWKKSPLGNYTPKLGYITLNFDLQQGETTWWWRGLWKIKCPQKEKKFHVVCTQ